MSSDEETFYTLYDPSKKKDIGGRYKGSSPSAAAAKAAKSVNVFPERKDYASPKKFCIRKLDGKRLEPSLYYYTATQKMVPASAFIKEQSGNDKMRKVVVHPAKE